MKARVVRVQTTLNSVSMMDSMIVISSTRLALVTPLKFQQETSSVSRSIRHMLQEVPSLLMQMLQQPPPTERSMLLPQVHTLQEGTLPSVEISLSMSVVPSPMVGTPLPSTALPHVTSTCVNQQILLTSAPLRLRTPQRPRCFTVLPLPTSP